MHDMYMILAFGITFGIVIMTTIYTCVRYIYSKEMFYISYCFMQLFSLLYIVSYSKLFQIDIFIQELALLFATLSAAVFAIRFYTGKFIPVVSNYKELIINTLLLNVVILTAFYHYILFEYLPYTIVYAILFLSVVFNLKEGFQQTAIYVVGWSVICFLLFVFNFKEYYEQKGFMDLVLLAFAIEAVLFTLSVSYKYSSLQKLSNNFENMLLHQSRLAKSGEMIANITHQFRQPLNNLSYILINMRKRYENQRLDEVYFQKKINQANEQLDFLSSTIDDFKEFYTPSKVKEKFLVIEAIRSAVTIMSSDLKKRNIDLELKFDSNEDIEVYGIKSEFSQAILALISNSYDALKDIEKPFVKITVSSTTAEVIIKLSDNAGGIKKKNLEKVFEPYFSTKKSGTGIGLYLVKLIIEKSFNGKINLKNSEKGVLFTIYLEK